MEENYSFQLLSAPSGGMFVKSKVDQRLYQIRSHALQRLRGRVYADRGAIQRAQLADDGRFPMRADQQSWHLLLLDGKDEVVGCARYRVHPNSTGFEQLLLGEHNWAEHAGRVRSAIERELHAARDQNLSYVEMGGWALAEGWRGTKAALELLLAYYALGELWGGALASCLASARNGSLSILRRTGGSPLLTDGEAFRRPENPSHPPVELLKFDSRRPAPRFAPIIQRLRSKLASSLIVQSDAAREAKQMYRSAALGTLS